MVDEKGKKALRSGALARMAGVSTDTLRHYERLGLLAACRSPNGYREWAAGALDRIRLVRRALSVGFRLDELARVLRTRDRGGTPCREVRAIAAARLESVEAQIRDLISLRGELRHLLEAWDARLSKTPHGVPARLLDMLQQTESPARARVLGRPASTSGRRRTKGK